MKAVRIFLRLITLVVSISAVVLIAMLSFRYVWEVSRANTTEREIVITGSTLERFVLGLYLKSKGDLVTEPANPDDNTEVTFVVEYGETPSSVAYRLERMGLIRDAQVFRRVVQYEGAAGAIQAGVYTLRPSMTMQEIVRELQHGRMPSIRVTIPEGWRAEEIAELLEKNEVTEAAAFMEAVRRGRSDYDFLRDRPAGSSASLEGFLYPDTYELPLHTTPDRVIDVMLQNWGSRVPESLRAKAAEHNMTLYEAVILASIVEREAVIDEERPIIASVYYNRLDQGMYLQSDPTVQYAKGYDPETGRWWNSMKQEEAVTVKSPYNTFLNPGLPPSPICNPGLKSIRAVLEPAETNYLFFYHKGDGTHAFAETYEEHLRNEQLYGGGQ